MPSSTSLPPVSFSSPIVPVMSPAASPHPISVTPPTHASTTLVLVKANVEASLPSPSPHPPSTDAMDCLTPALTPV
ncbi:hypothetical protein V6N13_001550 [Hibiscus sabdariffa]|uniref:Uncharacterized protein n=1 Tax=Hibiscus sabdariffa TaxID=183260 RepID=A0ABR2G8M7_9ROSI